MGMFDYYEPAGRFACPVCGTPLPEEWQGKDGPCALFVFREGAVGAIEDRWYNEPALTSDELAEVKLPEVFIIYASSCDCPFPYSYIKLLCFSIDGVWTRSEMFTGSEADRRQRHEERRGDWKARLRWLDSRKA